LSERKNHLTEKIKTPCMYRREGEKKKRKRNRGGKGRSLLSLEKNKREGGRVSKRKGGKKRTEKRGGKKGHMEDERYQREKKEGTSGKGRL